MWRTVLGGQVRWRGRLARLAPMSEPAGVTVATDELELRVRLALRRRLQLARQPDHADWDDEAVASILGAVAEYSAGAASEAAADLELAASQPAGADPGEPGHQTEPSGDDGKAEPPAARSGRPGAKRPAKAAAAP
jgi:hypothetical protein